jgi:hypothetical protein
MTELDTKPPANSMPGAPHLAFEMWDCRHKSCVSLQTGGARLQPCHKKLRALSPEQRRAETIRAFAEARMSQVT